MSTQRSQREIAQVEEAGALGCESLSELEAPPPEGGEVRLRGHMCVLPPSDLGVMTPERETCSGCSFWVNYTAAAVRST